MTVAIQPPPKLTLAEQRVVFHDISWQAYETILAALGNHRSSRLTYDCGTLEITMPLEEHEHYTRMIEVFIRILVVELGMNIKTIGSTMLNYPDLEKGAEPDNCYYIQNQPKVAGKKVDLKQDPPPDLVVETDISYTNIDKTRLYSTMGIPEFWRYNGDILRMYQLRDGQYTEIEYSPTFPNWLEKTKLYECLATCQINEVQAEKNFRDWVQQQRRDEKRK